MHFYPILFEQEQQPAEFEIPTGKQIEKFDLTKVNGTLVLEALHEGGSVEVDKSYLQEAVEFLSDPKLRHPLKETINETVVSALDERWSSQPDFKTELHSRDPSRTVTLQEMEMAFRATTNLLAAIAKSKAHFRGNKTSLNK